MLLFYHFYTFPFSSSVFYILFRPFSFAFHCTIFFTFFMFLYPLLHFFSYFLFTLSFFTLPCPLFAFYVTIFCSSLNYKVCLCYFLPSSSLLSLILFLFIFYFPLFSSCFYPLASILLLLLFRAFYTLFLRSFLPFFCYSILTFLCPQFHLRAGVFAFTLAKAFVHELKCPAITRLAGSITCRVTQFLRGSLLSLSLTIRGTANELAPHRFYARFCRVPRQSIGYGDTQKVEGPAGRREPGRSTFSKLLHESWKTVRPYFTGMLNNERAALL